MTDELPLPPEVLSYLVPAIDTFWRWETGGGTVCWQSGATLCFAAELHAMLSPFGERPLPPLDMLLLVAAATRNNWRLASRASLAVAAWVLNGQPLSDSQCQALHAELERLASWTSDLRSSLAAKRAIADSVFPQTSRSAAPHSHSVSHSVSQSVSQSSARSFSALVLAAVEGGVPEGVWGFDRRHRLTSAPCSYSYRDLLAGLQRLDPYAVRQRMETGLDAAPQAVSELLTAAVIERTRALMIGTFDDELLAAMARIARQLLGVVALPQPMAIQETLLDGGFSGISNRGTPDRLLQSELAHDELTFATRIVLGESLYLRRESPPAARARNRSILVDTGIRLWGVPRVFAAAVTLALAATADRKGELRVFRADGAAVVPVTIDTTSGLNALLAALSPHPHPGDSLAAWCSANRFGEEDCESILITARSTWEDREFRAALRKAGPKRLFAALVDREGRFELVRWSDTGERSLRQAKLDLSTVLDRTTQVAVRDPRHPDDVPAIFRVSPFPLRMWVNCHYREDRAATFRHQGFIQATQDRRLMYWDNAACPPIQLGEQLPKGRFLWHERTLDGRFLRAIFGNPGTPRLYAVDADLVGGTAELRAFQSVIAVPQGFDMQGQALLVVGGSRTQGFHKLVSLSVEALDWDTLGRIDYQPCLRAGLLWPVVPGLVGFWSQANQREFFHVSLDGSRITTTAIDTAWLGDTPLATLFRRHGSDGFCGITTTGQFVETLHRRTSLIAGLSSQTLASNALVSAKVSSDGLAAVCKLADGSSTVVSLPLDKPPRVTGPGDQERAAFALTKEASRLRDQRTTRWRRRRLLSRVAVNRHRILLQADTLSERLPGLQLVFDSPKHGELEWMSHEDTLANAAIRDDFHELELLPDQRFESYRLRKARCGALELFVDDRGLLHLRNPDSKQLEVTLLVQKHGPPVAWRSDGRRFGDPQFHFPRAEPLGSMEELYQTLRLLVESVYV